MLLEHKLNCQTSGLIAGPTLLVGSTAQVAAIIEPTWRQNRRSVSKRELIVDENLIQLHAGPQGYVSTFKIVIRAREGGEEIWIRPFGSAEEAFVVWARLLGLDLERIRRSDRTMRFPTSWIDGELEYIFAQVDQFTSTGTTTWNPVGIVTVGDYLVIAAGGDTGGYGGGGAGGMRKLTTVALTPGATVTVGNTVSQANGQNSVFGSTTSDGGGLAASSVGTGSSGGSGAGGGAGPGNTGAGAGGATLDATEGSAGGAGNSDASSYTAGGGGGGKAGAGVAVASGPIGTPQAGGNGGAGSNDSITGSSVAYARGAGGYSNTAANGSPFTAGTANRGDGNSRQLGLLGTGFVAVSYQPSWLAPTPSGIDAILASKRSSRPVPVC